MQKTLRYSLTVSVIVLISFVASVFVFTTSVFAAENPDADKLNANGYLNDAFKIFDHGKHAYNSSNDYNYFTSSSDYSNGGSSYTVTDTYETLDASTTNKNPKYHYKTVTETKSSGKWRYNDDWANSSYTFKEVFEFNEKTMLGKFTQDSTYSCSGNACGDKQEPIHNSWIIDVNNTQDYQNYFWNFGWNVMAKVGSDSDSSHWTSDDGKSKSNSSWSDNYENTLKLYTFDNTGDSIYSSVVLSGVYMNKVSNLDPVDCSQIMLEGTAAKIDKYSGICSITLAAKTDGEEVLKDVKGPANQINYFWMAQPSLMCGHNQGTRKNKYVFQTDQLDDFGSKSAQVISQTFNEIDPYKSYYKEMSYYTDLGQRDLFSPNRYSSLEKASSDSNCGKANLHILYPKNYDRPDSYGVTYDKPTNIITIKWTDNYLFTAVHEAGHAIGDLYDEYLVSPSILVSDLETNKSTNDLTRNCTLNPRQSYNSGGKYYGSLNTKGCAYLSARLIGAYTDHSSFIPGLDVYRVSFGNKFTMYRPTLVSIMDGNFSNTTIINRFNTVSCGYVLAALKANPGNGKAYFATCSNLDVSDKGTMYGGKDFNGIKPRMSILGTQQAQKQNTGSDNMFASAFNSLSSLFNLKSGDSKSQLAAVVSSTPAPTIVSGENIVKAGYGVQITSSTFTPEDNFVEFTLVATTTKGQDFAALLASSTDSGGSLTNPTDPNNPLWFIVNGIPSTDGNNIRIAIPYDIVPGIYNLRVANNESDYSEPLKIQIVSQDTVIANPPVITSITPTLGSIASVVTITGTDLIKTTSVGFGGGSIKPDSVTDTMVTFTVPNNISSSPCIPGAIVCPKIVSILPVVNGSIYSVNVVTSDQQTSNSIGFTAQEKYIAPKSPVIATISPNVTTIGSNVTISGSNLGRVYMVGIGSGAVAPTSVSDTQVTFVIPTSVATYCLPGSLSCPNPGKILITNGSSYQVNVISDTYQVSNAADLTVNNTDIVPGVIVNSQISTTTPLVCPVPPVPATSVTPGTGYVLNSSGNPVIYTYNGVGGSSNVTGAPASCTVPQNSKYCNITLSDPDQNTNYTTTLFTTCPSPDVVTSKCSFECADGFTLRGGQCVNATETYQ